MVDDDDKKEPEHLKTDPTVSAVSESGQSGSPSFSDKASEAMTPEQGSQDSQNYSAEASFSVPRGETVSQRSTNSGIEKQLGTYINDRYRVEREIARGGMGRVYMATQLPLGRPVAIKVLRSEFSDGDPKFPKRFFLEASVSSQLVHPNIITIHDYGETDNGDLFMAMEFLDGVSLSRFIKKNAPLDESLTIHIALQIARAVRVAHKSNVIHRDLKPGNVMVVPRGEDDHFVKVLDFGLVKMLELPEEQRDKLSELSNLDPDDEDHPVNLTKAGVLLGSPRYMSPEQIRGEDLDARTDIYSLGIIIYQMLSGLSPFMGETSIDVIYQHIHHPVPKITNVPCNEMLEAIAHRCLTKDRDQRYRSMSEVIEALKQAKGQHYSGISDSHSQAALENATSVLGNPRAASETAPENLISRNAETARIQTNSASPASFHEQSVSINQDPTPTNSAQFVVQNKTPSKAPMYLGALGLILVLIAVSSILIPSTPPPASTVPQTRNIPKTPSLPPKRPVLDSNVRFTSTPSGAEIYLDGKLIGTTPSEHKIKMSEEAAEILMKRPGFKDWAKQERISQINVLIDAQLVEVQVKPSARKKPTRSRSKKSRVKAKKRVPAETPVEPTKSESESTKEPEKQRKNYRNNPY